MGTDWHCVVQGKSKERGVWESLACTDTLDCLDFRSYSVFGVLAGVRGTHWAKPISEPRGLPSDFEVAGDNEHPLPFPAGFLAFFDSPGAGFWMGDHSHSYLSFKELKAGPWEALGYMEILATGLEEQFIGPRDWFVNPLLAWAEDWKDEYSDFRIVFGFDS